MGRFVRVILAVILLSGSMVVGARLVGSLRPVSLAVLFTNPNGSPCQRPCLFGVRPGHTTYLEAIAMLKAHPLTRSAQYETSPADMDVFSGDNVIVRLATDVSWISLEDDRVIVEPWQAQPIPTVSLAEAIAFFGPPDYVESSNAFYCYYRDEQLDVMFPSPMGDYVEPDERMRSLVVGVQLPADMGKYRVRWKGFTLASRYIFTLPAE